MGEELARLTSDSKYRGRRGGNVDLIWHTPVGQTLSWLLTPIFFVWNVVRTIFSPFAMWSRYMEDIGISGTDTIRPVPWAPSTFPEQGAMQTYFNGWGSLIQADPALIAKEDSAEHKKKAEEERKKQEEDEKKQDKDKKRKAKAAEDKTFWEWCRDLHVAIQISVVVGLILILILSIIGCYCCLVPSNDVVMYDAECPPMRSRRQSMVPPRVWPPSRRGSVYSRRGSSRRGSTRY